MAHFGGELITMEDQPKIFVNDFCKLVAKQIEGKKWTSIRTLLYQRGFVKDQQQGTEPDGQYVRPYFYKHQVADAALLLDGGNP